jgi:GNAT superfamily N-acetyltransferase
MEIIVKDLENDEDIEKFHHLLSGLYKEIEHEINPGYELPELIAEFRNKGIIKIALFDDEIVGLISLVETFSIYGCGKFGIINELYVVPDYRSRGVGTKLMIFAYQLIEEKGWTRLEVSTPDEIKWKRTLNFYLKEGFVQTGVKMKKEKSRKFLRKAE